MSNIRLTFTILQPVTAPVSSVRINLVVVEPLTDGFSATRLNLLVAEPLVGGFSQLRLSSMGVQALFPVQEARPVSEYPFPGFGNSPTDPSKPAAADPFYTPLPGLSIDVKKAPRFRTRVSESASGNETRYSQAEYPRWDFELSYEYLEDKSGAESSLKTILGFFLARRGSFESWLFKDPDDYLSEEGVCGIADGVTTEFPLCRTLGGFNERVGQVDTENSISVFVDGVLVDPADYTVVLPNSLVFDTAPAEGTITATFQFFFACRFTEDSLDFEKFADKLWNLQQVQFRSIIQ